MVLFGTSFSSKRTTLVRPMQDKSRCDERCGRICCSVALLFAAVRVVDLSSQVDGMSAALAQSLAATGAGYLLIGLWPASRRFGAVGWLLIPTLIAALLSACWPQLVTACLRCICGSLRFVVGTRAVGESLRSAVDGGLAIRRTAGGGRRTTAVAVLVGHSVADPGLFGFADGHVARQLWLQLVLRSSCSSRAERRWSRRRCSGTRLSVVALVDVSDSVSSSQLARVSKLETLRDGPAEATICTSSALDLGQPRFFSAAGAGVPSPPLRAPTTRSDDADPTASNQSRIQISYGLHAPERCAARSCFPMEIRQKAT